MIDLFLSTDIDSNEDAQLKSANLKFELHIMMLPPSFNFPTKERTVSSNFEKGYTSPQFFRFRVFG